LKLYVPAGAGGELVAPLPPGLVLSEDGRWSAAFAVAREAVGGRLVLVPAIGDAVAFTARGGDLAPAVLRSKAGLPSEDAPSPGAEPDVPLARTREDLADAEALVEQLRRRCSLSERSLSDCREKLVQAWAEGRELRDLLDSREASHELAKRRERDALDVVEGLEERAREAEAALAARRLELDEQCGLLQAELERREAAGASASEELAAAAERFQALQARSSDALEQFERARSEADDLRAQLEEAEAVARRATGLTAETGRELVDERAKTQEASRLADVHSERFAKAERELGEARQEIVEARAHGAAQAGQMEELEAKRSDAVGRLHEARSESEQLRTRFAEATRAADAAQRELADARRVLSGGAERDAAQERARADQAERRAAESSAQLADCEQQLKTLVMSEQALRQELELLTRTDLGEVRRGRGRRSKVSSDAYRGALASLEHERVERAHLEQETARLASELSKAAQSAPATVEADLRHLLTVTQRDLDEARAVLNEQQARYAAIAGNAAQDRPVPNELQGETARAEKPWSAIDEDLLNRIARAQEFAACE
jgi:chromosome segregation ATPase